MRPLAWMTARAPRGSSARPRHGEGPPADVELHDLSCSTCVTCGVTLVGARQSGAAVVSAGWPGGRAFRPRAAALATPRFAALAYCDARNEEGGDGVKPPQAEQRITR